MKFKRKPKSAKPELKIIVGSNERFVWGPWKKKPWYKRFYHKLRGWHPALYTRIVRDVVDGYTWTDGVWHQGFVPDNKREP